MTDGEEWSGWRDDEDDRLYDLYGKPLEKQHWGELVAIGPDGDVIFAGGRRSGNVLKEAIDTFGSGNFAFTRVGAQTLGQWLSL